MKIIIDIRSGENEAHIWEVVDSNNLICEIEGKLLLKFDESINEWVESEIEKMTVDELIKELKEGGVLAVYVGSVPTYIVSEHLNIAVTYNIKIKQ